MDNYKAKKLIRKYLDGNCTSEEKAVLESWYLENLKDVDVDSQNLDYEDIEEEIWLRIEKSSGLSKQPRKLFYKIAVAASILIVSAVAFLFYNSESPEKQIITKFVKTEIQPGKNKAILTLADGRKVILDNNQNGLIETQGGTIFNKSTKGLLVYNRLRNHTNTYNRAERLAHNTISTPNGGEYQIILPDGTKVWLNSASSLSFPVEFSEKDRKVNLLYGEAYFEVTQNKDKPFKVEVNGAEIRVLGTHFNVSAYADEPDVTTTLLEGSVQIAKDNNEVLLKPGQKAINIKNTNKFNISDAKVEEALAWKNGYFKFHDENIKSIMTRVSRWYDIDVVYEGYMQDKNYGGTFSRSNSLSDLLKNLERTGTIHFKIEGRRVLVMQ